MHCLVCGDLCDSLVFAVVFIVIGMHCNPKTFRSQQNSLAKGRPLNVTVLATLEFENNIKSVLLSQTMGGRQTVRTAGRECYRANNLDKEKLASLIYDGREISNTVDGSTYFPTNATVKYSAHTLSFKVFFIVEKVDSRGCVHRRK